MKSMEWCSKYWGCHQMPERSFFLKGYQLPVCARCTGMMIGEVIAVVLAFFFLPPLPLCCVMLVPLAVDGIVQYKTAYVSTNLRRVITGLLFGYSFLSIVLTMIVSVVKILTK